MLTTVITARDIKTIVQETGLNQLMDMTIQRLTENLTSFDTNTTQTPARDGFNYQQPHEGLIEWMPIYQRGSPVTIKLVGYHPNNPTDCHLPTILSTAMRLDTRSGHVVSIADTTFLTALRTGAASAVASRVLAAQHSKTIGLIGAGAQAITQIHALSRVFAIEDVLVYDSDPASMADFTQRLALTGPPGFTVHSTDLDAVCRSADIICTSTSVAVGEGPVFSDAGLKPWIHVNAVGSDFPGKTEVPLSLLQRALVCPDFLAQAQQEGECQQLATEAIGPDLVTLLKYPQRYSSCREQPTVFDSTGWALEDSVAMDLILELAQALNCGTELELANTPLDPKSPYGFLAPESSTERGLPEYDSVAADPSTKQVIA